MCKTYIVNGENKRFEYSDWEKKYTDFLKQFYKKKDCKQVYNDPDGVEHTEFYKDLAEFLNIREKQMKEKMKGNWSYEFDIDKKSKGIKVKEKNVEIFTIFSDQFGFSAPRKGKEKKHPYDVYAEINNYDESYLKNISKYVYYTRTLGGSFLWPCDGGKKYNGERGGNQTSNSERYYIEDRVDLTLLEIKNYYDREIENRILNYCLTDDMKKWFDHFKDFKTYIDFFLFQSFVDEENIPIPLVENEKNTDLSNGRKWKKIIENRMEDIEKNPQQYSKELEKTFEALTDRIKERTKKMEKVLHES